MTVMGQVVEKFILELEMQLEERHVHISLTPAAKTWLSEKGYDPLYGARPLARTIQEYVKKPLANELLFGKLADGGEVLVRVKDGELNFDIESAPAPIKKITDKSSDKPKEYVK